jgi:hypothetical protein
MLEYALPVELHGLQGGCMTARAYREEPTEDRDAALLARIDLLERQLARVIRRLSALEGRETI